MQVYAPSRTVVVYAPAECCDSEADTKPAGIPGLGVKGLGEIQLAQSALMSVWDSEP